MDEAGAIEGRCVCRVGDRRGFLLIERGGANSRQALSDRDFFDDQLTERLTR